VAAADFLAAMNPDMDLATAAGGGGSAGSGGTSYDDNPGDLLAGVGRLGDQGTFWWNRETNPDIEMIEGPLAGGPAPTYAITITPLVPGDPNVPAGPGGPGDPTDPTSPDKPNYYLDATGYNLEIDEAYMPDGTKNAGSGTPSYKMAFLITTNDGLASVSVNGTSLGDFPAGGLPDKNGFLTDPKVVDNGGGNYTLTFNYTQSSPHSHGGAGADTADNVDTFVISVTTINGATAAVNAHVDIIDDVPMITISDSAPQKIEVTVDESGLTKGTEPDSGENSNSTTLSGADIDALFDVKAGADGQKSLVYSLELADNGTSSGLFVVDPEAEFGKGDAILLFEVAGVIYGRTSAAGDDYFKIEINGATGETTLTLQNNLWHSDTSDHDDPSYLLSGEENAGKLSIVATVTDGDGDTASEKFDLGGENPVFRFDDDGPKIEFGNEGADAIGKVLKPTETGSLSDILLTGGADGIKTVQVEINEETYDLTYDSATGWAYTHSDGTRITITADGSVSITAGNELAAQGEHSWKVIVKDNDGDTADDTITFKILSNPFALNPPSLIVDESHLADGTAPTVDGPLVTSEILAISAAQLSELVITCNNAVDTIKGADIINAINTGAPAVNSAAGEIDTQLGKLTFTATAKEDGTYEVKYEYLLQENIATHTDNAAQPGEDNYNHPAPGYTDKAGDWVNEEGSNDWDESTTHGKPEDTFTFTVGGEAATVSTVVEDDGLSDVKLDSPVLVIDSTPPSYDLVLCVDMSLSMLLQRTTTGGNNTGEDSAPTTFGALSLETYEGTRLYATQVALLKMLHAYEQRDPDATVSLSAFNTTAIVFDPTPMSISEALTAVGNLLPGFTMTIDAVGNISTLRDGVMDDGGSWPAAGTNYTNGLQEMYEALSEAGVFNGDNAVRAYFISDGFPNPAGSSGNDDWKALLEGLTPEELENFELHVVGIDGTGGNAFDGVMIDGIGHTHTIPSEAGLESFINALIGTLADAQGYFELPTTADGVLKGHTHPEGVEFGDHSNDTEQLKAFVQKVVLNDGQEYKATYSVPDGELVSVDENGFPKADDGTIDSESLTITTAYGTFAFTADGAYSFTADPDAHKLIGTKEFHFTVTFMDADGDTLEKTFDFTIKGEPVVLPTIKYTVGLDDNTLEVSEAWLAAGSDAAHADSVTGQIKVEMDPRLDLGTVTFKYTDLGGTQHTEAVTATGDSFIIYSNTDQPLGTITIDSFNPQTGEVKYTFTLTGILDNAGDDFGSFDLSDPLGSLGLSVECTFVEDLSGNPYVDGESGGTVVVTGTLGVDVVDDAPVATADTGTLAEAAKVLSVTDPANGVLGNDLIGADGPADFTVQGVSAYDATNVERSDGLNTDVQGDYGKLVMQADGTYTYTLTGISQVEKPKRISSPIPLKILTATGRPRP
jgi:Mg-chelatase subunit ChlD